ncbi:MAG TPA: hypothetical protein VFW03_00880 [Gemmatimonadaceae bacterium]|nr:hypothetical protein [Gemmatimonadaceae bacterium]
MIRRLLLAASLLPWGVALSQQTDTTTKTASAAQEPTWSIPTRSLDFYAGLRSGGGNTDVMLGAKFSRRIPSTRNMAAAGLAEVAFGDQTQFLVGALFQIMPVNHFLLETGPGMEFDGGSNFFWRVGGEYELRARKLFIIPKFYVDFVNSTTVVGYGLAIGRGR